MREMCWSWGQLQETPVYVRRFTWDCMQARREAEQEAERRGGDKNSGVQRVRR